MMKMLISNVNFRSLVNGLKFLPTSLVSYTAALYIFKAILDPVSCQTIAKCKK